MDFSKAVGSRKSTWHNLASNDDLTSFPHLLFIFFLDNASSDKQQSKQQPDAEVNMAQFQNNTESLMYLQECINDLQDCSIKILIVDQFWLALLGYQLVFGPYSLDCKFGFWLRSFSFRKKAIFFVLSIFGLNFLLITTDTESLLRSPAGATPKRASTTNGATKCDSVNFIKLNLEYDWLRVLLGNQFWSRLVLTYFINEIVITWSESLLASTTGSPSTAIKGRCLSSLSATNAPDSTAENATTTALTTKSIQPTATTASWSQANEICLATIDSNWKQTKSRQICATWQGKANATKQANDKHNQPGEAKARTIQQSAYCWPVRRVPFA